MPNTPNRTVRIPDWIWLPALRKSKKEGVSISAIVRKTLWSWARSRD